MSEPTLSNGWEALGLPSSDASGYGYKSDTGILRSSSGSARPRQKRKHLHWGREFDVSFLLTHEQLKVAEIALAKEGYSWFPMRLVSGCGVLVPHCVRLMSPWEVSSDGSTHYVLTLKLEGEQCYRVGWFDGERYTKQEEVDIIDDGVDNFVAKVTGQTVGSHVSWTVVWDGSGDGPAVLFSGVSDEMVLVSSYPCPGVLTLTATAACGNVAMELDPIYLTVTGEGYSGCYYSGYDPTPELSIIGVYLSSSLGDVCDMYTTQLYASGTSCTFYVFVQLQTREGYQRWATASDGITFDLYTNNLNGVLGFATSSGMGAIPGLAVCSETIDCVEHLEVTLSEGATSGDFVAYANLPESSGAVYGTLYIS